MSFRKIIAGAAVLAFTLFLPVAAQAKTPDFEPDGVMGQSLYGVQDSGNYQLPALLGTSKYTQSFIDGSFTTQGKYINKTFYHRAEYEDFTLLNGIDVSWHQSKYYPKSDIRYRTQTAIDWKKAHADGIDFAYIRIASADRAKGELYFDTSADSHIQGALKNDINVGVYIFSQALTEKRAVEEAEYVLDILDKYGWDVTLPIAMDREPGTYGPLRQGKLSKAKETAIEQAFIDTIVDAGYQVVIYSNYNWFNNYINGNQLENCKIWFARYSDTTTSNKYRGVAYADIPVDYEFWQYGSSQVTMAGYSSSSLDMNFWYKDTSAKTEGLKLAAESDGSITLTWDEAAEDVTGYRVYRYDPAQGNYTALKSTADCTYTDRDVEAGKSYLYKVRCYWTLGGKNYFGAYSDEQGTVTGLAQVSGVRTEKQSSTYLTLAWDAVSDADGYRIYQYNAVSKKYDKLPDVTAETTSVKVEHLNSAEEYRFKVRAFREDEDGRVWGSCSNTHKEATKPLKVKGLKAVPASAQVTLSWKPVARSTGYQVFRLNSSTGKYEKIATVRGEKQTTHSDTDLKKGTAHIYKVRAYRSRTAKNDYGVCSAVVECIVE